jgi:hypothetical protein
MRKRKLTSPLSWFFEPKTTLSDLYMGKPITYIKETSALAGKRISSISDWSYWVGEWTTWPTTYSFTVGKPTLKVSKKEDIKFV